MKLKSTINEVENQTKDRKVFIVYNKQLIGDLLASKSTNRKWTKGMNRHCKKEIAVANTKRGLATLIVKLEIPFFIQKISKMYTIDYVLLRVL